MFIPYGLSFRFILTNPYLLHLNRLQLYVNGTSYIDVGIVNMSLSLSLTSHTFLALCHTYIFYIMNSIIVL